MRRNENRKRIIVGFIAFFLALIMVIGLIAPFLARAAESDASSVNITTQAGMNGIYKVNRPMPVNVFLENNGGDFKGEMQIKVDQSGEPGQRKYIVHSYPMELPGGGTRKITMDITVPVIIRELKIDLTDKNGKVIKTEKVALKGIADQSLFFGALTDTEGWLDYFKSMAFHDSYYSEDMQISDKFIYLEQEGIEVNEYTLSNFTTLIINNYDTGKLSGDQINAIRGWVNGGGNLIIGTGVNYDKVFKNINTDFIPVVKSGMTVIKAMSDPGRFFDSTDSTGMDIDSAVINPLEGRVNDFEVVSSFETPVTYYYPLGRGGIILHCFDLGLSSVSENFTAKAVLNNIYRLKIKEPAYSSEYENNYMYILTNILYDDSNLLQNILRILLVYIIIIGPVLYFILKKFDKREKGWLAIPAASFLVVLVIFALTRNSIYSRPFVNSVNNVTLTKNSSSASVNSEFLTLTSDKGDVKLSFDSMPKNLTPVSNIYYNTNSTNFDDGKYTEEDIVRIEYGESPALTFYDSMSWNNNYFTSKSSEDIGGNISAELYLDDGRLKGILINNTDMFFDELIIQYDYFYKLFENVEPGQVTEIDIALDYTSQDYIEIYNSPYLLAGRIMGEDYYNYGNVNNQDDYNMRLKNLKRQILDGYMNRRDSRGFMNNSAENLMNVSIFAFNSNPFFDKGIRINSKAPIISAINFFNMKTEIFSDGSDEIVLNSVMPTEIESGGINYYFDGNDRVIFDSVPEEIEFTYRAPAGFEIESIQLEPDYHGNELLEIYDPSTNSWINPSLDSNSSGITGIYSIEAVKGSDAVFLRYVEPKNEILYYPRIKLILSKS